MEENNTKRKSKKEKDDKEEEIASEVEVEQIGAKDVKGGRQVWEPGEEMEKFAKVLLGNAEVRLKPDVLMEVMLQFGTMVFCAYTSKNLEKKRLPVQRLVLIQPIEAGTVTDKSQE